MNESPSDSGSRIAEALTSAQAGVASVPVVTDLDGATVDLHVHVVPGSEPGPTLAVISAQHGSEWFGVRSTLALLDRIKDMHLAGNVLVVPVANPIAFATGTRNIRDESDSPDMNRSFGSRHNWPAAQLANALFAHVLVAADAVVDFHTGPWGAAMKVVACARDYSNPVLSQRSFDLARAFGLPHIQYTDMIGGFPGPHSLTGHVGEVLGIPAIVVEVGGSGFDPQLERHWEDTNVRGVLGIMRSMGIIADDDAEVAQESNAAVTVTTAHRVNPFVGGMLEPVYPAERLMQPVEQGDLLGRVWSPYTFEVTEELIAPVSGLVGMAPGAYPIRPGHWAYLVFETEGP